MSPLLELSPRRAGVRVVEPGVEYAEMEQSVYAADRCPVSCVCFGNTNNCVVTGHTRGE